MDAFPFLFSNEYKVKSNILWPHFTTNYSLQWLNVNFLVFQSQKVCILLQGGISVFHTFAGSTGMQTNNLLFCQDNILSNIWHNKRSCTQTFGQTHEWSCKSTDRPSAILYILVSCYGFNCLFFFSGVLFWRFAVLLAILLYLSPHIKLRPRSWFVNTNLANVKPGA